MKTLFTRPQESVYPAAKVAEDLSDICDFVRYAITRFEQADIAYGHGTSTSSDEAIFMVLESLRLPVNNPEPYWHARLTMPERQALAQLIEDRISTRKPAPYLLNKTYLQHYPFYVDERVIVPRSYIAEILCHPDGFAQIPDYNGVTSVLDLCTGSGCLAIIAADIFPNATVDAVDLSPKALEVARRNVADYGFHDRVFLHEGNLFAPLGDRKYDLIITNPPYVDKEGMDTLPPEYRAEPVMALDGGADGLDIVHRIMKEAKLHLNNEGGMLCEVGRCAEAMEAAYPDKPFLWIGTEHSTQEVFWLDKADL
jgi:ribosomal protein L3 glutamine methyltransferase